MLIRPEKDSDIPGIRRVAEAAFPLPLEARLVEQLRRDGDSVISLVAVADTALVGHVMFSVVTAPFKALGLAPVAVLPEWQGKGIGSALIRDGLAMVIAQGWQGVFVLGAPEYYTRFGFSPADAKNFQSRYAGPHFMLLACNGGPPVLGGPVEYAPAFVALERGAAKPE